MKQLLNLIKINIIIATLIASNVLLAQDDLFEDYAFDDNDAKKTPYFALSFGGNVQFLFMNYDEINKKPNFYEEFADKPNFSGPIFGWGFHFFTAMSPLINNARIGINHFSGSQVKEFTRPLTNEHFTTGYNKLSVRNTGIHFDYAFVPLKSLAILSGLGLKLGTMTLEQYATQLPASWDNPLVSAAENLKYSYIAIEPQISVEYAITGFLMLRAAGSYMLPFDNPFTEKWTINGKNPYSGVPKEVKPQGFSTSIGLYLGLFNY